MRVGPREGRRALARLALLILVAAAPTPAPAGGGPGGAAVVPRRVRRVAGPLTLEAPAAREASLEALAARATALLGRLEAELGVRPAGPFRIILIPPGKADDPEIAALDAAAPDWAAGFMQPDRRVGAIRLALADRYPYADLASVLTHEMTHLLLHDAAGGRLPRWFEEGVATGLERSWGLRDAVVWSSSLLTGRLPRLADLDAAFDASDDRARGAYAASFDFLSWTVRRYGERVLGEIVRAAADRPFDQAWETATGRPLAACEAEWRRGSLLLYRWVPALTGTGALWGGITALFLAAAARRRSRSRAIRERWAAEEGQEPPEAGAGVRTLDFFRSAYEGRPPWDIGRPQPEVVRLWKEGAVRGSVLDAGCGTGENALYLAGQGHEVWGIDGAPLAIEKAVAKARERGLPATFVAGDALDLADLPRVFDTILDCGLFHVFPDPDRARYARGVHAALAPGGRFLLLCFSDLEPGTEGPRRVTQAEIRSTFGGELRIDFIRPGRFEADRPGGGARAWVAAMTRA
jgi:SAM-dependent methyltransferase